MGDQIPQVSEASVPEVLKPPTEEEKLRQFALAVAEENKDIFRAAKIVDNDSYVRWANTEIAIKGLINSIEDHFAPLIAERRKAWQERVNQKKELLDDLLEPLLAKIVKSRLNFEEMREAARKAKEIEEQKKANEGAKEETKQIAQIMRDAGEVELAKQIEKEVMAPMVTVESDLPQVKGVGSRKSFEYVIVTPAKVGAQFCSPDSKKIKAAVDSMGFAAAKAVGGIRVFEKTVGTSRAPRK